MVWNLISCIIYILVLHFFQEMFYFMKQFFLSITLITLSLYPLLLIFHNRIRHFPATSNHIFDIPLKSSESASTHVQSSSISSSISQIPNAEISLDIAPSQASSPPTVLPIRRSNKSKQAPSYLRDYHCKLVSQMPSPQSDSMVKRSESDILYPLSACLSYDLLSPV